MEKLCVVGVSHCCRVGSRLDFTMATRFVQTQLECSGWIVQRSMVFRAGR